MISTKEDPNFHCDPPKGPELGKWTFIGLLVYKNNPAQTKDTTYKNKVQVYFDTKLVCEKKTNHTIMIPALKEQFVWQLTHNT